MKYLMTVLFLTFALTAHATENTAKALKTQIETMVKELDTKEKDKVKAFIKKYADSKHIADMEDKELDKMVEKFMEKKQKQLQEALMAVQEVKPEISEDKTTYTFKIEKGAVEGLSKKEIVFYYNKDKKVFQIKN